MSDPIAIQQARPAPLTRRAALTMIAIAASGGVMMPKRAFAQGNATSMLIADSDVCAIIPEVTEGPYYFDPQLVRTDITEGRPGIATLVRLQVVDAMCQPLPGARVDIWHCGADGLYSNYPNQGDDRQTDTVGETFLRGTQFANEDGLVEFDTIYPGWYRGRTTHIHFKVFLDETNVLTGQIFFPDALSEYIYRNIAPYNDRASERDTLNTSDRIAAEATHASFAHVKEEETRYLASLIVGVDPNSRSVR